MRRGSSLGIARFASIGLVSISAVAGSPISAEEILNESFQGVTPPPGTGGCGPLPAGWSRINNDGRTPDPLVGWCTQAWCGREDPENPANAFVGSVSYYSPIGAADDWLITPQVQLGAFPRVSWKGETQDPSYPETYELRISTGQPTVGDFVANPALATVVGEVAATLTAHDVGLAAYANQLVYLAWRNVSNDKFILWIVDVRIYNQVQYDSRVTAVSAPLSGYTRLPGHQRYPIERSCTVENVGLSDVSDFFIDIEARLDGAPFHSASTGPIVLLSPGFDTSFSPADLIASEPLFGILDLRCTVEQVEGDENPFDNEADGPDVLLHAEEMARDDGNASGAYGLDTGTGGELGLIFRLERPAVVRGVRFYLNVQEEAMVGQSIRANLREVTEQGKPGDLSLTSDPFVVPQVQGEGWKEVEFPLPVSLPAGEFFVGLVDPDGAPDLSIGTSGQIYTPGVLWFDWPTNPAGVWVTTSAEIVPMIRPLVTPGIFIDGFDVFFACPWSSSTPTLCF